MSDSNVKFFSDPVVQLIQHMGSDLSVIQAARVSTNNDFGVFTEGGSFAGHSGMEWSEKDKGLIRYLLREKHGTPFEHNSITFRVEAPIFVFREFHRHRVGFSYNEMSGRYTKLEPEFYIPSPERPLINVGTSSKPEMAPADEYIDHATITLLKESYEQAWTHYESLLNLGIANEVARAVLPVGIKSKMYVTANLRAWMNFLSLRTHDENAAHVSRPQYEIELVARKIEHELGILFPLSMQYFNEFKRVSP